MLGREGAERAGDAEVVRGRRVSLEGFSFAFRAKTEEWRDLQLVFQITSQASQTHDSRNRSNINDLGTRIE